jgi:hypothetical protein
MRSSLTIIFHENVRSDAFWLSYFLRLSTYLRGKRLLSSLLLIGLLLIIVIFPLTKGLWKMLLTSHLHPTTSSS